MQAWWESLTEVLRVLYCIAIPSSLILLLQLILTTIGGHSDGGMEFSDTSGIDGIDSIDGIDLDGDGIPDISVEDLPSDGGNPADFGTFRLLTLQTIVTFLAVFGWVSIICISSGMPVFMGIWLGIIFGTIMMAVVAKIVQMSSKLAENGILNLKNAIGETATVYVPIPPKNSGNGKITMQLQGRFCELEAVTESQKMIETGKQVLVTDVLGDVLVVEES